MSTQPHSTDVIIIGAGPVGLFAVFELGLSDMRAALVDVLDKPGGQCAELYPEKPIYDIPALPVVTGQGLTDGLMKQIAPFNPAFFLNQKIEKVGKTPEDKWCVETDAGQTLIAPVLLLATGGGIFTPRKPPIPGIEACEGTSVFYAVRNREALKDKNIVIAGGGDSALDWALNLQGFAGRITLVHRRDEFRAAPDSVNKMRALVADGKMDLVIGEIAALQGLAPQISGVMIRGKDGAMKPVACDTLLAFYGLTLKPGPLETFGIELKDGLVPVNVETFETSQKGLFAIGDACTYPGKVKLILSGFHEGALMARGAFPYVHPDKTLRFLYTTSSSDLQEKLGVK